MIATPRVCMAAFALAAVRGTAAATATDRVAEPESSFTITGFYYAMREQPDITVGVASLDRGSLHLEGRYNYEVRDAGSVSRVGGSPAVSPSPSR
jgi:hypothetical protein